MTAFLFYILKVSICSGILFGYYWLILRNKIFHQWNRFYLLASIVISLVVPLLKFQLTVPDSDDSKVLNILYSVNDADAFVVTATPKHNFFLTTELWLVATYSLIAFFLFSVTLVFLFRVINIIRSHTKHRLQSVYFLNTEVAGSPFSFFNYIIWNINISLETPSGQQIFQHELTHITQKHSYDKAFCLLMLIPFWANPFFWLMRKELNDIHEFIADKNSVTNNDTAAFAKMILASTYPKGHQIFANPFFQSSIKRRLAMLSKNNNPKINYVGRILILPLLALLIFAFTIKAEKKLAMEKQSAETVTNAANNVQNVVYRQPLIKENKASLADTTPVLKYKGKEIKEVMSIKDKENINYILVYKDGKKEIISEEEAKKANLKFTVNTVFTAPVIVNDVTFGNVRNIIKDSSNVEITSIPVKDRAQYQDRFIFVNGKPFTGSLHDIPPSDIESISVIKSGDLVKQYGEKASNGILMIVTKQSDKDGKEDGNLVFTKTEVEPQFKGGQESWLQFLRRYLNPEVPAANHAPEGTYTVSAQFIVDEEGNLSDIKPITNLGYGMEDEVIRVLKLSPAWAPALQNNHKVKTYMKKSITFVVPKEYNVYETNNQQGKPLPIDLSTIQSMRDIKWNGLISGYEIKSFAIVVDDKKGGVIEHVNEGTVFDAKTKEMLAGLKQNDLLILENIRGIKNGEEKKFPAKAFIIE